jgi:hypothetical protein
MSRASEELTRSAHIMSRTTETDDRGDARPFDGLSGGDTPDRRTYQPPMISPFTMQQVVLLGPTPGFDGISQETES